MNNPTEQPGAHYIWGVYADMKDGTEEYLGTVEVHGEVYGDKTDADGMALFRAERTQDSGEWVFREHALPMADVRKFRVVLIGATNLAAALPAEPDPA